MDTDKHRLFLASFFVLLTAYCFPLTIHAQKDYTKYVDPFIGTGGHGHTFPGATVPFGFVQLSPDTRVDNWDGSGGYHYSDSIIYGFSHTHLSGTGIPDYCDILLAPYVSEKDLFEANPEDTKNGYASKFSHKNEKAEPGYYSVLLEDENILAEMTATKRVGFHRYTFPENSNDKRITLDLKWRDEVLESSVRIVDNKRIEGFRRSSSWAKDQVVYFAAEFSAPFDSVNFQNRKDGKTVNDTNYPGKREKAAFLFKSLSGNEIQIKVAISSVSTEGARKNLESEIKDWDFDKVKDEAREDWNKELSKIEVSGGTEAQMTNFYSALYHTMIAPNIFQDVDGKYLGLDKKIHEIGESSLGIRSPRNRSVRSPRVSKGSRNIYPPDLTKGSVTKDPASSTIAEALPNGRATDTRSTELRNISAPRSGSVRSPRVSKGSRNVSKGSRNMYNPNLNEGAKALSKDPETSTIAEVLPNGRAADTDDTNANYTIFSLWDTFRATHPLYTIIDENRTAQFINTFIRQYEQGGKLPVWELAANETDTMIGYHAVSVIADAMAKGITGFDYEKAYEASKHSSELNFRGLDFYRKRGYISMEDEQESVSKTLEYAYNDYCIAVMAKILKTRTTVKNGLDDKSRSDERAKTYQEDYEKHLKRSQFYKNLFDKQTGFMRPKQNGNWISPFAPNEVTFHFTEGNSWVYSFFVPHDISGLISLHGGKENFTKKLDALFSTEDKLIGRDQPDITGLIGQYAHGNEPSHHIAYLYNYADQPWKTQDLVRRIMDEFYKPTPDGLIGNEDCGQMSAWYILSALGFYQVNPSVPVYTIGSPLFKEAKIHLENGKTFSIKVNKPAGEEEPDRISALRYVKSAKLNGAPYRKTFFSHSDIKNGGTLEFKMSAIPVKDWFTEPTVSQVEIDFPPVPTIAGKRVFEENTAVEISTPEPDVEIFYTRDGTDPSKTSDVYKGSFTIDKTTIVKAIAANSKGETSLAAESKLNKMPHDWDVKLLSTYNRQYTGGGAKGLIDGIRGTANFASGEWQGYQDQDLIAVVDLRRETEITKLGGGFLQVARSWIWMPTKIEFETSMDGENFTKAAEIKTNFPEREMTHTIKDYVREIAPIKARYIRIKAANLGKIPDWHPGAGFDAFIFVDEIIIE